MRDHAPASTAASGGFSFHPTRTQIIRFAFSLLIATLLWAWVTELNDPFVTVRYRELDIGIGPLDDSLQIVSTLPRATVTLRGPESQVDAIKRTEITVTLDTSEVTEPGDYRLKLQVMTPDGPSVRSVEPSELPVTIEKEISQIMPVEVQPAIPENDPREITSTTPETTQVTVSGPSSSVNRVEKVILPVSLDNRTSSFQDAFTPYAVDSNGQRVSEVQVLPAQIMTRVEIQSRGKTVSVIPVVTGLPSEGFSLQQRAALPDSVVVDGPAEALESLLFVNTEPVDITGATQSSSKMVGLADLPAGVTVIEPENGEVEVRVAIEDISTTAQTLSDLPVQPINLDSGFQANIEPGSIDVTVDGPGSILTGMTPTDVKIRADLAGLGPGTYDVQPEITVPQGVTWISNTPETVHVTIEAPAEPPTEAPASTPVGTARPQSHAAVMPWTATRSRFRPGR